MRRGQVSLEFMFIFAIMAVLLVYSWNNATFESGSNSVEVLNTQTALEAKDVANRIAGAIDQVYSQGPGSKATVYIKTYLLSDPDTLKKAFGSSNVSVTYSGKFVRITLGNTTITSGDDKNTFSSMTLYNATSVLNQSFEGGLPKTLAVVVEWNPNLNESWSFDSTNGELYININPGG